MRFLSFANSITPEVLVPTDLNDLRRRSRPKGYIFCGPKKLYLTRIKKKQGIGGLRSGALHNGGDCVPLFLARNVQEQPKGECHE